MTPQASHASDIAISARIGTLGVGGEISKLLTSHLGVRAGGYFLTVKLNDREQSDITYDMEAKVRAFNALIDLYPSARGSFHLTGGIMTAPAKVTATARTTGGSFEINGNSYTSSQVGTLTGTGEFSSVEPYAGFGFGTAASQHGGLGVIFDAGLAIGKPKIALTATGASGNAQLQNDLTAQIAKTQKDADKLVGYPLISLGLIYRF